MMREHFISKIRLENHSSTVTEAIIKQELIKYGFDVGRRIHRKTDFDDCGIIFFQLDDDKTPKKKTKVRRNAPQVYTA